MLRRLWPQRPMYYFPTSAAAVLAAHPCPCRQRCQQLLLVPMLPHTHTTRRRQAGRLYTPLLPPAHGSSCRHVDIVAAASCSCSEVTNTFNFLFKYALRQDAHGNYILPKQVLPSTGG